MKKQFVKDLTEGQEIKDLFLVQSKNLNYTKAGKTYLACKLGDRTGSMVTRIWDNAESLNDQFFANDFIEAEGRVVEYNGALQLAIKKVRRIPKEEIDPLDFLPTTPNDIEAMWLELMALCDQVQNRFIDQLLKSFFADEQFIKGFKMAPAAKGIHHVYIGGLLEHTLSLVKLCRAVTAHYKAINGDILIAAAVLHDAAKMDELSYEANFDYTAEGRLVGHIAMGINWVQKKIDQIPDFPEETALHIKHILASHHGIPEFGTIKEPMTPEAVVFHHIDNIDAKMWTYITAIEQAVDLPGPFTPYHSVLQTFLYKGDAADRGEGGYGFYLDSDKPKEPMKSPVKKKRIDPRTEAKTLSLLPDDE